MIASRSPAAVPSPIAQDVLEGLSVVPRRLPPKLFYDAQGSHLFERITELPEYYLTRTERSIFRTYAAEIVEQAGGNLTLIELGAGSASKTRILIEAAARRQLRLWYYPVDVSSSALQAAVGSLNGHIRNLRVHPVIADYSSGLPAFDSIPGTRLVLFIGSTIGNFEPEEAAQFLKRVRAALRPGDAVLVGFDLAKDPELLHAAYNDSQGVTAAFNENVLARINRELGGRFDLNSFKHVAFWSPEHSRVEMHLESRANQHVWIQDLNCSFSFAAGERIHTENSYKFTHKSIAELLTGSSFHLEKTWTDPRGWFAVAMARV